MQFLGDIKEAIEHCWDRKDYPEVFRDDAGLDISIPGFITRGSWIRNNSPRTVTLDVTTYRGVTLIFNRRFQEQIVELSYNGKLDDDELTSSYKRSLKTGAMFDALTFQKRK